ncbi:MAG TPA: hypothetical protein VKY57_02670 [Chitinispirillaceae bacterium]|nr:hypothetical protein [Chitinispirillaceae bacterium]
MNELPVERTVNFKWNSRHELYEYFRKKYGLNKHSVDNQIHLTMSEFRPRRGQVIKTQELWQKVGLDLEKELQEKTGD